MATIRELILSRLRPKIRGALVWSDIATLIGGLSAQQKGVILAEVKAQNGCAVGNRILAVINAKVEELAQAEATSMLQDGALSADDIARID